MIRKIQLFKNVLVLSAFALSLGLSFSAAAQAGDTVTMTVTATGKKGRPPGIKKEDIQVFEGRERVQVADWRRGENLFMGILIDDSLDTEAASQWNDVRAFVNRQAANTYIALAYGRNGAVTVAQDFTQDHALVEKALRIPIGGLGAFSSPYLSVQDWVKRWPSAARDNRSSIILISSGIDYFRGGYDPLDPDLQTTIEHAQKANINLWTIYYPGGGHFGRGYFRVFNAQANLSRMSEETGAESYYLGYERPVNLSSYFDEIQEHLENQYLLTFAGSGGKKGKFERVRVMTELPNVQFLTPSAVFLPPSS